MLSTPYREKLLGLSTLQTVEHQKGNQYLSFRSAILTNLFIPHRQCRWHKLVSKQQEGKIKESPQTQFSPSLIFLPSLQSAHLYSVLSGYYQQKLFPTLHEELWTPQQTKHSPCCAPFLAENKYIRKEKKEQNMEVTKLRQKFSPTVPHHLLSESTRDYHG